MYLCRNTNKRTIGMARIAAMRMESSEILVALSSSPRTMAAVIAGLVKATKDSDTVTLSGASGSVTAYSSGSTATVRGYGVTVDSALASGSTVTIGTVADGFRPPLAMYATCASVNSTACGRIMVTVNANGTVQLTNRSGASLATTSALYFTVTYVI